MAAISIAINRGVEGFAISDFTVGTAAPTASTDVELRFNTTDQNSNAMLLFDVIRMLKAIQRTLEQTGGNVNIITAPTE